MIFNFFKKSPAKIIKENFDENLRNLESLSMSEQGKVLDKLINDFHSILDHKNDRQNLIFISKQLTINRQLTVSAGANSVKDLNWISIALMEDLSQVLLVDEEGIHANDALGKILDWIEKVRKSKVERIYLSPADSSEKTVITCGTCNQKLRVPVGREIEVKCPKCGTSRVIKL